MPIGKVNVRSRRLQMDFMGLSVSDWKAGCRAKLFSEGY